MSKKSDYLSRLVEYFGVLSVILTALITLFTTFFSPLEDELVINKYLNIIEIKEDIDKKEIEFKESISLVFLRSMDEFSFLKDSIIGKKTSDITISKQKVFLIRYFANNFFDNSDKIEKKISISVSKADSALRFTNKIFYNYNNIFVEFKIDKNKAKRLFMRDLKESDLREFLKYGDYIEKKYTIDKNLRLEAIYIIIGGLLFIMVLIVFIPKIGNKKNESEVKITNEIPEFKKIDKSLKKYKSLDKSVINELKERLNKFDEFREVDIFLFAELNKSYIKSRELYNRSTLMLISGLIMAITGMIVFYLALPDYSNYDIKNKLSESFVLSNYILKSIRPIFILIFIQSISWYLLRQYRVLIEDYKYFNNLYQQKANYLTSYNIIKNLNNNEEILTRFVENVLNRNLTDDNKDKESVSKKEEKEEPNGVIDFFRPYLDKYLSQKGIK